MTDTQIIVWKMRNTPGITVTEDDIIKWPIGVPRPTASDILTWRDEYETAQIQKQLGVNRYSSLKVRASKESDESETIAKILSALALAIYGDKTELDKYKDLLVRF